MKVLDEAEEIELRDMDEEDDVVNMERLNKQSEAMKRANPCSRTLLEAFECMLIKAHCLTKALR